MTAGRINQVCTQPFTKSHKGLVLLLMVCTKWACELWLHQQWLGKLSNCKHLWATPPHYHHEHNVRISTSEQATSRKHKELCTHPGLPLTASVVATTQNLEQQCATPTHGNNNTTMWNNPVSNQPVASPQGAIRIHQPKHIRALVRSK